jgi:hypothetical protein
MSYKLTDESIAQIAKLLQIAILTGTDIVDNLRTMRFKTNDDETLDPTDAYLENFETNLNKMIASLAEKAETTTTGE